MTNCRSPNLGSSDAAKALHNCRIGAIAFQNSTPTPEKRDKTTFCRYQVSPVMHATTSNGLSTVKVHELQKVHGLNEIAARQEPEWKKVLKRYLDPISLTIVSFPLCIRQRASVCPARVTLYGPTWSHHRTCLMRVASSDGYES